jgi:uncharacterized integral membrane protein (TIGR00698 family)
MLILRFDSNEYQDIGLEKGRISIGRHPDNDIVLPSMRVSAFHAEIIHTPEGKTIFVDFGSLNGSYVDGARVEGRVKLSSGSTVFIDKTQIKISNADIGHSELNKISARKQSEPPTPLTRIAKNNKPREIKTKHQNFLPADEKQRDATRVRKQDRRQEPVITLSPVSTAADELDFPSLTVVSGMANGACYDISGTICLGRAASNDIVLEERTVSGRHAQISKDPSHGWLIKDLGSKNGVKVNGARVTTEKLKTGDKLTLGNVELIYRFPGRITELCTKESTFFGKRREKAIPHFRPLLAKIMESARKSAGAELGTLFLPDNKTNELWSCIIQDEKVAEIRISNDKGLAGNTYQTGQTINIQNAYEDARFHREIDEKSGFDTRSVLCVPVTSDEGETIGVIQVLNKIAADSFTTNDEHKLENFAKHVAKLLQKAGTWSSRIPGLLAVIGVAALAFFMHSALPQAVQNVVGAVLVAVSLGVLINNTFTLPLAWVPGIQFALHTMLRLTIVLLGARLAFDQVLAIGAKSLVMIFILIFAVFVVVHLLAKKLKVPVRLATLIAVGTAICGNSAIAATAPVIKAKEEELSFAVATNTLLGTLAVLLYPLIGTFFGFTDPVFGTWAGVAVNDTAQVVATGFAFSPQAGEIATVVKLTRNTLMAVVVVVVGFAYVKWVGGQIGGKKVPLSRQLKNSFPGFVIGFLIAAMLNSLGVFSQLSQLLGRDINGDIKMLTMVMILGSLAGVGLGTDLRKMRKTGLTPLYIGVAASLTTALVGYALIRLLGPVG